MDNLLLPSQSRLDIGGDVEHGCGWQGGRELVLRKACGSSFPPSNGGNYTAVGDTIHFFFK